MKLFLFRVRHPSINRRAHVRSSIVRKAVYVSIRILTAFNGRSVSTTLSFPVADPDQTLIRGGPGSVLLALPVVRPCDLLFFYPKLGGGGGGSRVSWDPPLDPPLISFPIIVTSSFLKKASVYCRHIITNSLI